MKVFGAFCIVSGASGFGFWLSVQYRRRLAGLEQLRQMIFLLKGQILYANAALAEALEAVGERSAGALASIFAEAARLLGQQEGEPFAAVWSRAVREQSPDYFTKTDMQELEALGTQLGFLDRDMQERTLLLYLEQLDLQIGSLRDHRQERCRLYSSLGVMGGLFLTVLLI